MARAEGKVPLIQWKVSAVFGLVCSSFFLQAQPLDKCVLVREFIYDKAPFRSAHASTIVETPARTLLAAWFGGTSEGNKDVEIWLSRRSREGNWSTPIQVTDTPDMPVWNPVLFQDSGKTWLFFKVGPSPREWVGGYRISSDDGLTWSPVEYLPAGLTGPIRTKPLRLSDGTWLAGTSVEAGYDGNTPASAPYRSWSVWVERSTDRGITWTKQGPIVDPDEPFGVIQPTLWETPDGEIRMLMRSTERLGRIMRASSKDRGMTWTPARVTELPNPNAGIDAVRLRNGLLVLVYNHLTKGRGAIHVAVSGDDGETWGSPVVLEDGQTELSYPAVIQAMDGAVHITYTWNRTRIRHLILDADALRRR
jgi:predicted neuraminidase